MPKPIHESTTSVSIEWWLLVNPLIILLVTVMLGAALVVISLQYQQYIKDWKFEQRKIFGDLEAKHSRLQEAIDVVNNLYLQKFSQLKKEGFFLNDPNLNVEDQRLNMYQAIKQLLSRIPLVGGAGYQLLEKQIYRPSQLDLEDEVKTYETKIILKLNLLHEEDVLQLVDVVEFQQFTGLFNFTHCQIKRLREEISPKDISKANFEAECILAWYISEIKTQE